MASQPYQQPTSQPQPLPQPILAATATANPMSAVFIGILRVILGAWLVFLAVLLLGMVMVGATGMGAAMWVYGLFFIPTLLLSWRLSKQIKAIGCAIWFLTSIGFSIFAYSPAGKAAHAADVAATQRQNAQAAAQQKAAAQAQATLHKQTAQQKPLAPVAQTQTVAMQPSTTTTVNSGPSKVDRFFQVLDAFNSLSRHHHHHYYHHYH